MVLIRLAPFTTTLREPLFRNAYVTCSNKIADVCLLRCDLSRSRVGYCAAPLGKTTPLASPILKMILSMLIFKDLFTIFMTLSLIAH